MNNDNLPFGVGIRILTEIEASTADLGALKNLQGAWSSSSGMGWNVISVPGTKEQEFVYEVIPYTEKLTFTPVVAASNRGPFIEGQEETQNLVGLLYEQEIFSECDTDFCKQRGFPSGAMIHAERGIFLNVANFNSGFDVVRLSTIPHGNSVLAPGTSNNTIPATNDFFGEASTEPSAVTGSLPFGYGEGQFNTLQFANFPQTNPNLFLQKTLGDQKLSAMTTLDFSTKNTDGGVLNIPFIQKNIKTTDMEATFWIEELPNPVAGQANIFQLQYTQTINLVFPPTGAKQMVVWPHVTVNTLRKMS
ncbi:heme-binding protein [Lacihabitans lacunae]|uniref:Heme-binding protein n=1 Tax=Lacihabitans lacunae TaxID=1028214 RepID=A0ABV7Z1F7_9BACT